MGSLTFRVAPSGVEGLSLLRSELFHAAVINTPVAGWPAEELLEELCR